MSLFANVFGLLTILMLATTPSSGNEISSQVLQQGAGICRGSEGARSPGSFFRTSKFYQNISDGSIFYHSFFTTSQFYQNFWSSLIPSFAGPWAGQGDGWRRRRRILETITFESQQLMIYPCKCAHAALLQCWCQESESMRWATKYTKDTIQGVDILNKCPLAT